MWHRTRTRTTTLTTRELGVHGFWYDSGFYKPRPYPPVNQTAKVDIRAHASRFLAQLPKAHRNGPKMKCMVSESFRKTKNPQTPTLSTDMFGSSFRLQNSQKSWSSPSILFKHVRMKPRHSTFNTFRHFPGEGRVSDCPFHQCTSGVGVGLDGICLT